MTDLSRVDTQTFQNLRKSNNIDDTVFEERCELFFPNYVQFKGKGTWEQLYDDMFSFKRFEDKELLESKADIEYLIEKNLIIRPTLAQLLKDVFNL